MGRYRPVDTQPKVVAIGVAAQLLPGTFEHAQHHLLEQAIDLMPFDAWYRNDMAGAPAYAPGMLLRVVLFAYARGIVSSRAITRACEEQVTFIALSGDSRPHFSTIAHFVSTRGGQIAPIADGIMRKCDTRIATQDRLPTLPNPLHDKSRPRRATLTVFGPEDLQYDPVARACVCPAGEGLHRRGAARVTPDHIGAHVQGAERDCGPCALRAHA